MSPERVVIVGTGEAGARAAISLRERGFAGDVALVGEERHQPYSRPPLSKAAMTCLETPDAPVISDLARLSETGVTVRLGVRVVAIHRAERCVRCDDGSALPYDKLVLATGASARRLDVPGAEFAVVLRDFDDSLRLRERMRAAKRIAIVGGGFIGMELAASGRSLGREVVVIEAASRILQRATPIELSSLVETKHRAEGVELLTGVGVAAFDCYGVVLIDGRRVEADLIIVGVGAAPSVELAREADLALENGVWTDARLRTNDPDIYACGDCASFPHRLFGGRRLRLESWRHALDSGAFVAGALMGDQSEYLAIPWFWSDQYEMCLQIAGLPDAGARIARRPLGDGAELIFHLTDDGTLVGAGGWGPLAKIGKEIRVAEMLIAKRARLDSRDLENPGQKLKALL